MTDIGAGPAYTSGKSFRARAEARQRQYRSEVLKVGWSEYGHFLADQAQREGANFLTPSAFEAARKQRDQGKGVAKRTFENMLSSQAMCFNLFAPLAEDLELASAVLSQVLPRISKVTSIQFEYTPPNDIFGDQTGRGGVDCDLLVEGTGPDGAAVVVVIETKFVEPEFSTCGFRAPGRSAKGQPVCPDDVAVRVDSAACFYTARKGYRYWERTWEVGTLHREALPLAGCPFAGHLWQLWVNHALAHVEAQRRGATRAIFAVCAPEANEALAARSAVQAYQDLVIDPSTVVHVDVDVLVSIIGEAVSDQLRTWHAMLARRYARI
jgi:hypothetical protein